MALMDICVAHWTLDETSGTRADSHGSNDLTDNNTVTAATGALGNAADFNQLNSEYLSNAGTNLRIANWSMALWVRSTSWAWATASIWGSVANNRCWRLTIGSTNAALWASSTGLYSGAVKANKSVTLSTGVWHFIACGVNGTQVWCNANNSGTRGTATMSGNMYTSNTQSFYLGRGDTNYYNGLMDNVSFFNQSISAAEETELYNGGTPLAYPFGPVSPSVSLPGRRLPRGIMRGVMRGTV